MRDDVGRSIGAPSRLRVTLLGPATITGGDVETDLPDRAFGLLAFLALQTDRCAKRETLRTLLWGESERAKANSNLRQLLSRLRRTQAALPASVIGFGGDHIRLLADETSVDLLAFLRADPQGLIEARDVDRIKTWIGLYGGELLENVASTGNPFDEWLLDRREDLRERFLEGAGAVLDRADLLADEDALAVAARVRAIEPASDPACRAALRVHARRGSPQAACRVYEAYRQALNAGYGIEPTHRTRELARSLGLRVGPDRAIAAAAGSRPAAAGVVAGGSARDAETAPRFDPRPRILILPPVSIIRHAGTQRLARAFIEDVTVVLSRYRSFTVLAPHTAKAVAEAAGEDGALIGRNGADYVVCTALKPTDRGLAMTFRLSGLPDGGVLSVSEVGWDADDLTTVFGHLVRKVVDGLVDAIERTTLLLPATSPDASAYRMYLEGRQCLGFIDLPSLRRAKRWFRDAAARAQNYASPLIGLARTAIMEWFVLGMPADNSLLDALGFADRGLTLDPLDWQGLREKALSCLWLRHHDECLALFERALSLGPNDADLIADYADALAHCGEPERGLDLHARATRLNPLPPAYYLWIKGSILFQTQRYEAALDVMRPLRRNPATARLLAACAARAGRGAEAQSYARTLREVYPDFRADSLWRVSPNRRREDTAHFVESLKLAGVA